jgi:hypothetical protein
MRIKKELTTQNVGGENVILLQGKHGLDTTKIVSLNETALWLWNRFAGGKDFTVEQVAGELASEYGIESELAAADARAWVGMLLQNTLIEQ